MNRNKPQKPRCGQSFPKELRLRKTAEFARVYDNNVYAADDVLVVQGRANDLGLCRLGISASRKVGNAVVRNRWKRLIREAFRLQYDRMPPGIDLVVRPRKGAQPDYQKIFRSLPALAKRVERKIRSAKKVAGGNI